MTSLASSDYPDRHDPHRCGNAPFVPRVDSQRQHSCGSYEDGFNEYGCNKYLPNYPDDLYIEEHGCKGLSDCQDGVPPTGDIVKEGSLIRSGRPTRLASQYFWPIDGHGVPYPEGASCLDNYLLENFEGKPEQNVFGSLFYIGLIIGIVWLTTKIR